MNQRQRKNEFIRIYLKNGNRLLQPAGSTVSGYRPELRKPSKRSETLSFPHSMLKIRDGSGFFVGAQNLSVGYAQFPLFFEQIDFPDHCFNP